MIVRIHRPNHLLKLRKDESRTTNNKTKKETVRDLI